MPLSSPNMSTSTSFSIRKATPADVPELRQLIDASVRGLQAEDYTPTQIESALATVFGVDSQLIADGTYFVAEAKQHDGAGLPGAADGASARRSTAAIIGRGARTNCSIREWMQQRFERSSFIRAGLGEEWGA